MGVINKYCLKKIYLKLIATYILPRFSFIAVSIFNSQWSCAFMITPSRRIVFIIFTIRPLTPTLTTSVGKSIYLCILIDKLGKLFIREPNEFLRKCVLPIWRMSAWPPFFCLTTIVSWWCRWWIIISWCTIGIISTT